MPGRSSTTHDMPPIPPSQGDCLSLTVGSRRHRSQRSSHSALPGLFGANDILPNFLWLLHRVAGLTGANISWLQGQEGATQHSSTQTVLASEPSASLTQEPLEAFVTSRVNSMPPLQRRAWSWWDRHAMCTATANDKTGGNCGTRKSSEQK
jgi:hypothetical protein